MVSGRSGDVRMIGIQNSKKASSGRSGDVRVVGVQRFKKQAKKKTPTDLDRALSECGPTSPDSILFLGFSKIFFGLGCSVRM